VISAEDVRRLLESDRPDAALMIIGGRPVIASEEGPEGGLSVISRADLLSRAGDRVHSPEGLAEVAAELDVAVRELGG
jgi:hypothetical protein